MDAAAASAESGSCPLRCTRFFTLFEFVFREYLQRRKHERPPERSPQARRLRRVFVGMAGSLQHDRQRMFQKILKAGEELNGEQAVDKPMIDG